ncbi:hypothetical protein FACS189472_11400 [Alphaproteobacteria bacterium]|nr:hypothetical protein FACS189472_11400 [Alphaproteobacteria bacterium]
MTYDYWRDYGPQFVESINVESGAVNIRGSNSVVIDKGNDGSLQLKVHPNYSVGGEGTIEASNVHYMDVIIKDENEEDVVQPVSVAMELDRLHEGMNQMEATNVHYKDVTIKDENDEDVTISLSVEKALDEISESLNHPQQDKPRLSLYFESNDLIVGKWYKPLTQEQLAALNPVQGTGEPTNEPYQTIAKFCFKNYNPLFIGLVAVRTYLDFESAGDGSDAEHAGLECMSVMNF